MDPAQTLHPTAVTLLEAGARLANTRALSVLTVDAVVEEAGTGKGTFYRYFANQEAFLVALHHRFLQQIRSALADAVSVTEPGAQRLAQTAIGYLDACLGQAGLKAFLTEARVIPIVSESVDAALASFAAEFAQDYRALGIAHPEATAHLMVAMAHEVALTERLRGRPDPALRASLLALGRADGS